MIGIKDFALSSISALAKSEECLGQPVHVTIEPTTACNLKCPVCETGAGILKREQGSMPLDNYKIIIDKMQGINTILLYYMGETFLNKDAYEMISYASAKGIYVMVCTNGEYVQPARLAKSGIGEISFQLGGISENTHVVYRVNGNLSMSLKHLIETIALKRRHNYNYKVVAGLIVMKHNEHEISSFKEYMYNQGVDRVEIISPCVRNIEQGEIYLPKNNKYWYYDVDKYVLGGLKPRKVPKNSCPWIYYSTVITWNGDVLPCCRDAQGDYVMGNILEQDFEEIWNGLRYREFRYRIAHEQKRLELCKLCSGYGYPLLRRNK